MNDFVVDASVSIAWVHPSQATTRSESLLREIEQGATVTAPALWTLETANALLVLRRRRIITEGERKLRFVSVVETSGRPRPPSGIRRI